MEVTPRKFINNDYINNENDSQLKTKKMKFNVILLAMLMSLNIVFSQDKQIQFKAVVKVSDQVKASFLENGRFYLFLSKNMKAEPRTQVWPSPTNKTYIFAKNIEGFDEGEPLILENDGSWLGTSDWSMDAVPEGEYNVQILWDQDKSESRIDAPGNLYSLNQKIKIDESTDLELELSEVIGPRKVESHELARVVEMNSKVLSSWWKKPVSLKATVLLPSGYKSGKPYPIRYNVAGYGGRYTRINYLLKSEKFMEWWKSDEAPQIITVFLDGEGPFGDSYQLDSENNGPYGQALTEELIPYIESEYRGTDTSTTRFVDGCSTGGWVSLALQLFYPDLFNGVYSYSPDAIDFEHYQLINIYKDQNAYINEHGYLRPVMRDTYGEPMLSLKEFVQYENVLGDSNSYLNSGGQFSAHTALYSPKGKNELPKPLFDQKSGEIDAEVAEAWKKYDLKLYAEENWKTLGSKLQGKVFIWMGDMDHFYLNMATRSFGEFLKSTKNPNSDAVIVFDPMKGHCSEFSNKVVLQQIQQRLEKIKN